MEKKATMMIADTLVTETQDLGKLCDTIRMFGVDPAHVYIKAGIIPVDDVKSEYRLTLTLSLEAWALLQKSGVELGDADRKVYVNDLLEDSNFRATLKSEVLNYVDLAYDARAEIEEGMAAISKYALKQLSVSGEELENGIQSEIRKNHEEGVILYMGQGINFGRDNI